MEDLIPGLIEKIKSVQLQTFGGLLVLNASPIRHAKDLIAHRIGVNTPGACQEWLITVYLQKASLSADEISKVIFRARSAGQSGAVAESKTARRDLSGKYPEGEAASRLGIEVNAA